MTNRSSQHSWAAVKEIVKKKPNFFQASLLQFLWLQFTRENRFIICYNRHEGYNTVYFIYLQNIIVGN